MKDWYKATIAFQAQVKKEFKEIKEDYILRASSYGDAQDQLQGFVSADGEYIKGIIEDRIPSGRIKPMAIVDFQDIYVKPSVNGIDSRFYFVKVEITGPARKWTENHLTNATNSNNANDRVKSRLKSYGIDHSFDMQDTKLLKNVKGIYDSTDDALVEDFAKRQEHLKQNSYSQYIPTQETIPGTERGYDKVTPNSVESDPNAITAMVIANGVTEVETEDLNNGKEYEAKSTLTPIAQLPAPNDEPSTDNTKPIPTFDPGALSGEAETFQGIKDEYKTPNQENHNKEPDDSTLDSENGDSEEQADDELVDTNEHTPVTY